MPMREIASLDELKGREEGGKPACVAQFLVRRYP
jgi:hypothetical protein